MLKIFQEQQQILEELLDARYFDSFSYNTILQKWSCFSCNHPERARLLLFHPLLLLL